MEENRIKQQVHLSLGSNLGNRHENLRQCCQKLSAQFGDIRVSSLYESEPINCPLNSPPYINACVEFESRESPETILEHCLRIERELGRKRSGIYGEARICDIDLINYGEYQCDSAQLVLPHPRAHQRAFVLQPLCELAAQLTLAGQQQELCHILEKLPAQQIRYATPPVLEL